MIDKDNEFTLTNTFNLSINLDLFISCVDNYKVRNRSVYV